MHFLSKKKQSLIYSIYLEGKDLTGASVFKTADEAISELAESLQDYYYDEECTYVIDISSPSFFNVTIEDYDDSKSPRLMLCGMSDEDNKKAIKLIQKIMLDKNHPISLEIIEDY